VDGFFEFLEIDLHGMAGGTELHLVGVGNAEVEGAGKGYAGEEHHAQYDQGFFAG
jgi:hypothetical protein